MSLLDYFSSDEFTTASLVTGGSDGTYDSEGKYTAGTPVEPVDVLIIKPQPLSANDLRMFETGEYVTDFLRTYTEATVATRRLSKDSDKIIYAGRTYKVMRVDDRSADGGFLKLFIMEITLDNQ